LKDDHNHNQNILFLVQESINQLEKKKKKKKKRSGIIITIVIREFLVFMLFNSLCIFFDAFLGLFSLAQHTVFGGAPRILCSRSAWPSRWHLGPLLTHFQPYLLFSASPIYNSITGLQIN
jgi:hypothetical protein